MKHFVMNANSYFFVIEDIDINKEDFVNCRFFDNVNDLYEAHVEATGVDLDEIEGGELVIKYLPNKGICMIEARGFIEMRGMTIEEIGKEISEYII